jgi:hypothetical protein
VIASVDTYLRFAEQVNRLDLRDTELAGLPELQEKGAKEVTEHKLDEAEENVGLGSRGVRDALKGAAAGAAVAGAAAAAKTLADRSRSGDDKDEGADDS